MKASNVVTPRAEPAGFIAGGKNEATLNAQDRAVGEVRQQYALDAERGIADPAEPRMRIRTSEIDGDIHFKLILYAKTFFVNDVLSNARSSLCVDGGTDHGFIFRECLLRDQRTGQVELTARPRFVCAEGAQVPDDFVDFFAGQGLAEGGHDRRESAAVSALENCRFPVDIELGSGLVALGEVGKGLRLLEAHGGIGHAFAVGAVAPGASRLEDFLSGVEMKFLDGGLCGRGSRSSDCKRDDQAQRGRVLEESIQGRHSGLTNIDDPGVWFPAGDALDNSRLIGRRVDANGRGLRSVLPNRDE